MPILIRPVREQLEHDRIIRLLQAKWKKKYEIEANVGDDRLAPVKLGQMTLFPDLVQHAAAPARKLVGMVEVETGESVNNLEAMAQWTHMSRSKAAFQLYVPASSVEQARRLCQDHQVALAELWSYFAIGEQIRFTLVQRDDALAAPLAVEKAVKPKPEPKAAKPAGKVAAGASKAAAQGKPAAKSPASKPGAAAKSPAAKPGAAAKPAAAKAGAPKKGTVQTPARKAPARAAAPAPRKGTRPAQRSSPAAKRPASRTTKASAAKRAPTPPAKSSKPARGR